MSCTTWEPAHFDEFHANSILDVFSYIKIDADTTKIVIRELYRTGEL